jgi:hypothetical protein
VTAHLTSICILARNSFVTAPLMSKEENEELTIEAMAKLQEQLQATIDRAQQETNQTSPPAPQLPSAKK